jgi:Polysaccharide deacetylase
VRVGARKHVRWLRSLAAALAATLVVGLLAAAGYGFVIKSIPYQTPQQAPPRVSLTAADVAGFSGIPSGLPEVPVLAWRDVSLRPGHLVTNPVRFATELAALRRAGFRSVRPRALADVAAGRRVTLPRHPVLLTFDDGLSTNWTTVDPILRHYGFTAVVFIDPANVAAKSPSYFLTSQELQAMSASGRWDVGVQLRGRLPPGPAAVQRASQARDELAAVSGRPVTAYAWPRLNVPSRRAQDEPSALYSALSQGFAVVLGRPQTGTGNFVAHGPARGPLPRVSVTAADNLQQLSMRLRVGVQAPPARDPLTLPWQPAGGKCHASAAAVRLSTRRFALCTLLANGTRWHNYQLSLSVKASARATAIVELRASIHSCVEVAIGRSQLSIKQRVGRHWRVLQEVPAAAAGLMELLGPDPLPVTAAVHGRQLQVTAGGLIVNQQLSRAVGPGVIALGLVSPGGRASAVYHHPAILTHWKR